MSLTSRVHAHYDARGPGWQLLDAMGRMREHVQYVRTGKSGEPFDSATFPVASPPRPGSEISLPRARVLVCDRYLPTPDRDAGSVRMDWMLRLLAPMCAAVTFVPDRRYAYAGYAAPLRRAGVQVASGDGCSIDRVLAERPGFYDLVILSRAEVANRYLRAVRRHQPRAQVVFDTVELLSLRFERQRSTGAVRSGSLERALRMEDRAIRHSDVVLAVSEDERREVTRRRSGVRTQLMPLVYTVSGRARPQFGARRDLLFVGNFSHPPNADAVRWFAHDVLPLVRTRLDVILHVAGPGASREIAASWGPYVSYEGWVPDLHGLYDSARVAVAPLRYGAGVKGQVGEALAIGLPCVTTTVGAAGMDLVDGTHLLIADAPAAFARAVVRAYTEMSVWTTLSESGGAVAAERWSPPAMSARLAVLLRDTMEARERVPRLQTTLSRSSPTVDVSITCGGKS